MNTEARYQTIFYATAFLIVFVLTALIFWPFLIVLSLAAMTSVLLGPAHLYLEKRIKSKDVVALLLIVLLLIIILGPISLIVKQVVSEAQDLYAGVASGNAVSLDYITLKIESKVKLVIPEFKLNTIEYISTVRSWVIDKLGGIFGVTLDVIIKTFLFVVALFYFIRDGGMFKESLMFLSPLPDNKDKVLVDSLKTAIKSVFLGSLVVAVVQGTLAGLGFVMFGVPNFTLWGMVAAITSLVPGVGTALVWGPAVIYLYFYGNGFAWVGLLIWSILIVGMVDNFLAPIIINKGINVHPLLVLFSILGGLQFFGPTGFLLGPLVVSLLFVLIRIASMSTEK
jgi:predicted PurR-regulated permease PerM